MTHWSGLSWGASVLEALRCVWPAHVNKQRGGAFILAGLLRCSDVMLRVALNTLRKGIFVSLPFFWFIISKCLKLKTCRRFRFIFCVFMNISVHPPQAPPPRLRSTVIFQSDLMLKKNIHIFSMKTFEFLPTETRKGSSEQQNSYLTHYDYISQQPAGDSRHPYVEQPISSFWCWF